MRGETIMKIGYIGLGLMGGPLARNLIRAGQDVLVYDLSTEAVRRTLAAGTSGRAASRVEELADCDVVFTSLPLPEHVRSVMLTATGLLNKLKPGSIYIDVSTINPQTGGEIEEYGAARGIKFIACPLGKGPAQAETAAEPIFAGGDKAAFEEVLPILKVVGSPVHYLGGVKQAYAFKLISNMVGMTNLAVLAEGLRLGEKAGIDAAQFQELLAETGANSFQLQVRGPWILNNDFANRFGVSLALKDVRLGSEMADEWNYDARFTKLAKEFYERAEQEGLGKEDCNAVYKVL
jgi:3-hydroxyisobutyrate dehydrogenase-like beta-hydroxyacid dehydrogenase